MIDKNKLEPGYYWVRWKNWEGHTKPFIAEYIDSGYWEIMGTGMHNRIDNDIDILSKPITFPLVAFL